MSVTFKNGIGFGSASGSMFLLQQGTAAPTRQVHAPKPVDDTAEVKPTSPLEVATGNPWSPWGVQNNLPETYLKYIDNCTVLTSGIEARSRLAIGKGLTPYLVMNKDPKTGEEELKYCNDMEILDFLEENDDYTYALGNTRDSLGFAWDATRLLFNRGGTKITRFERIDIATLRLGKANGGGIITDVYESWDWAAGRSYDAAIHKKIPLLRPGREWEDIQQRTNRALEYCLINRNLANNRFYYPLPLWWAAKIWVEIAMEIPVYRQAAYKNQMSIKYVVHISKRYWENNVPGYNTMRPEEQAAARQKVLNDIDTYLVGSPHAHKSILATVEIDPQTGKEVKDIYVEVLDDKMKDGRGLPDSSAAEKHISFALLMNPAITGNNLLSDGASGGAGSGSDIREATLVQLMMNEFERRKAARVFNVIKKVNGWQDRYPNNQLVFRYPTAILTTLDTGKSTKTEKS
jgi:hypothetical protein